LLSIPFLIFAPILFIICKRRKNNANIEKQQALNSKRDSVGFKYNGAFLEIGKKVEYCGLPVIAVVSDEMMFDCIEEEGEDTVFCSSGST
jgi:hypothetical protein